MIELRLPFPPSVNTYKVPHPKVRGVYFLTKRAKQFREEVVYMTRDAHRFGDAAIILDIVLHPPDRRRRDADNYNKCIWDALQHARVFDDDCQVESYRVTKGIPIKGGLVIVKIWERSNVEAETQSNGQIDFTQEGISRRGNREGDNNKTPF
jgi:crossover junction endodeoxyribonuclease RusA